uniref:Uncharacterized protein n=1 Tax=Rhizophora mucronata TaxID=61149 RepID=A0A2P2P8H1_RHIMU
MDLTTLKRQNKKIKGKNEEKIEMRVLLQQMEINFKQAISTSPT